MARQGVSGIVTGGGLDPFVAATIAQRRKAQDDRVLESMRQSGEDRRQDAALMTQRGMQTERLAAVKGEGTMEREFREAEGIKERKHRAALEESRQEAETGLQQARLDQEKAMWEEDLKLRASADEREADHRELQSLLTATNQAMGMHIVGKLSSIMIGDEKEKTRLYDQYDQIHTKYTQDRKQYTTIKDTVQAEIDAGNPLIQITPPKYEHVPKGKGSPGQIAMPEDTTATVNSALSKLFVTNQIPIGLDPSLLDKGNIKRFEEILAGNEYVIPHITTMFGVLDGAVDSLKKAREDVKRDYPENGRLHDDMTRRYYKVKSYRDNLESLKNSTFPMSDGGTVGDVLNTSLGISMGNSPGSFIDYQLKHGKSYETMQAGLEAAQQEIPGLIPVTDDMRPSLKALVERHNKRLIEAHQRVSTSPVTQE